MPTLDLTGERYGRLTALHRAENHDNKTAWVCACDCGNQRIVSTRHLRHSDTRECKACAARTQQAKRGNTCNTRKERPTFISWQAMKSRCLYSGNAAFYRYGGRGIEICSRWVDDFEAFLADMGPRPSSNHSIDRIDSNGNYTPENCRWATSAEQGGNRRDCYRIEHEGEVLSLADFCRATGLSPAATYKRAARRKLGHDFKSAELL